MICKGRFIEWLGTWPGSLGPKVGNGNSRWTVWKHPYAIQATDDAHAVKTAMDGVL